MYHPEYGKALQILPAIDCVTLPSEIFDICKNDLKEIYELREKIQQIAIDKFQAHKSSGESFRG